MDYYLKTTSKEDFLQDLVKVGIEIEMEGNYYQDENIIIDWIGQIPDPIVNEDDPIIYKEGQHVNIRSNQPIDVTLFENTLDVYPEVPYRIFS